MVGMKYENRYRFDLLVEAMIMNSHSERLILRT